MESHTAEKYVLNGPKIMSKLPYVVAPEQVDPDFSGHHRPRQRALDRLEDRLVDVEVGSRRDHDAGRGGGKKGGGGRETLPALARHSPPLTLLVLGAILCGADGRWLVLQER